MQVGYGFVNFFHGGIEFFAGQTVVVGKPVFEVVQFVFKVGDVNGLVSGYTIANSFLYSRLFLEVWHRRVMRGMKNWGRMTYILG